MMQPDGVRERPWCMTARSPLALALATAATGLVATLAAPAAAGGRGRRRAPMRQVWDGLLGSQDVNVCR